MAVKTRCTIKLPYDRVASLVAEEIVRQSNAETVDIVSDQPLSPRVRKAARDAFAARVTAGSFVFNGRAGLSEALAEYGFDPDVAQTVIDVLKGDGRLGYTREGEAFPDAEVERTSLSLAGQALLLGSRV